MSKASNVESLFFAALEKQSAAERAAFLDTACGGDTELRRQVEKLLKAEARVGDFLQKPVFERLAAAEEQAHESNVSMDAPAAGADSPGAAGPLGTTDHVRGPASSDGPHPSADAPAVPGYRVLREIARGGMGRVLAAYDLGLDRDVALKVLLPGASSARFVRESKITARLPHPGIPPVHALGTLADGSPFLAMKLIAGRTLAEEMKSADRPRLVQAFTQVCQAVGFAHSRGIIHRDLKPANVMVGAFGEVQVMDWGLAKDLTNPEVVEQVRSAQQPAPPAGTDPNQTTDERAADESTGARTQAGAVMGTPAYMAPEQARGESTDARADVFALGGILCAILTGRAPYSGKSPLEVIRRAGAADLGEAHTRLDGCGADAELVALCRGCLSPNPADRPTDGQAVADALTSYLDGVQERLRRAELEQVRLAGEKVAADLRLAEQRRRFRLTLALAGTVLLALTLVGGVWLWVKIDREERLAKVNREVSDALGQAGKSREKDLSAALEQVKRAMALIRNGPVDPALATQAEQLQAELDEDEKDRALLTALTDARLAEAETRAEVSEFALALSGPKFRDAFTKYGMPAGQGEPDAAAKRIRERPAAVQEAIITALHRWRDLAVTPELGFEEPHLNWLRAVSEAVEPDAPWSRRLQAARRETTPDRRQKALQALADSADVKQLPVAALIMLARQIHVPQRVKLLRRAQAEHPGDFWVNHELGWALGGQTPPEWGEAVRFLSIAVALRPLTPGAYVNLGDALRRTGKVDEAIECARKAIELSPNYAAAHNNLGAALHGKGQVDKAIASYKKALEFAPKLFTAHFNLGTALKGKGRVNEAIASFKETIACLEKAQVRDNKYLLEVHGALSRALADNGQVEEAIECYKECIALDPKSALADGGLGKMLGRKGKVDEVIECYKKSIALDPKHAMAHHNLGAILCDVKRDYDAAIACFRKAIALEPNHAGFHVSLGVALASKSQLNEAIEYFKKAIVLDPKLALAHNHLGLSLSGKGQLDAAVACYNKAIALDPKFAEAHNNLGNALKARGQVDEAIACYKKSIELDPKDALVHTNLGNVLQASGQVNEAIACFRKAIALEPKAGPAHNNLGTALAEKGQLNEAIASLRKAIALEPKLVAAHANLGEALRLKGQVEEAIASLRKAIALDPKLAEAHTNLGNALYDKGQVDEAIACYKKSIELDPKHAGAHTNLGTALHGQGQVDEAIECYKKAIALDPKNAIAHSNLGNVLKARGQVEEAIACFRKAIALDPKLANAHTILGAIFCDVKRDYDEAIDCFRKAIAIDPKLAWAHYCLGNALKGKGRLDEAITSYRKAIALDSKLAQAHTNLGVELNGKGKVDEAIACFHEAIALDPKLAQAHSNLGGALLGKGQLDEAIASLRKATELNPKSVKDHYNLGVAWYFKGKPDEAVACFRQAVALDPKSAQARSALGESLMSKGQVDEAIASLRKAIALDPNLDEARAELTKAERLAAVQDKLSAFLKDDFKPTTNDERLGLASWCQIKKHYRTSARLYADAFAEGPKLADDLKAEHRYHAAQCAVLAAAGKGEDAAKLDKERARLRKQTLDWLKADLALWSKRSQSGSRNARRLVTQNLQHWLKDSDLAGIRDEAALAKLPAEERAECEKLWADVAALLKTAGAQPTPPKVAKKVDAKGDEEAAKLKTQPKVARKVEGNGDEEAAKLKRAEEHLQAGKQNLAVPLLVEVVKLRKARLGPDHADTLNSMNQLGVIYWRLRQLDKSIPLFEQIVKSREKKLGRDHLDTLGAVANLGVNYKDAGQLKKAIPLLEEAQRAVKKHPQLAWVTPQLIDAYQKAGENGKVAALLLEQLPAARKELPKDSPQLGGLLAQIGLGLLEQKKWAQAEPLLRESLTIREKKQPDAWNTFNGKSMLGGALLGQKKYADAEPLLLAGYQGMKKQEKTIPPPGRPRLGEAVERLVQLYEALGKKDEAARWKKERETLQKQAKKEGRP